MVMSVVRMIQDLKTRIQHQFVQTIAEIRLVVGFSVGDIERIGGIMTFIDVIGNIQRLPAVQKAGMMIIITFTNY